MCEHDYVYASVGRELPSRARSSARVAANAMGIAIRALRNAGLPADEAERIRQEWCEFFARLEAR